MRLYKIQWRAQGEREFHDWVQHRYGPEKSRAYAALADLRGSFTPGEGCVVEYEGEWPPLEKSIGHICFCTNGFEYYGHNLAIYEADFSLPVGSDGIRAGSFYATKHGWKTYRRKGLKFLTGG